MTIYEKDFVCRRCGETFRKKARKAYYCDNCIGKVRSDYVMKKRAEKDPNVKIGVGSGGNQWGEKNSQYKTGRECYRRVYDRENPYKTACAICGSDRFLLVHHIDGNRKNNAPENLIKLCRSCHASAHNLAANYMGTQEKLSDLMKDGMPEEMEALLRERG